MKKTTLLLLFLLAALACPAAVTVQQLRCEYRENPLGIDVRAPRLSWQLVSSERGQRQTAYRILVASAADLLARGQGDLWDSGKIVSDQSLHVRYAGKPLAARQQCFWKVQTWDKDGKASDWSPVAMWEIGLPDAADWQDANWIRLARDPRQSSLAKRPFQTEHMKQPRLVGSYPSPLFRREFTVKPGVVRARAYVCGVGYAERYLNGQRAGDAVLDPGQTTYDVRALYVTHDLTKSLAPGTNAVGVMLGNGFMGQSLAFGMVSLANGKPALIAKIVVDYADGTTQIVATDESWKVETGPVLFDNVYAGETYDARLERKGWSAAGFAAADWQPAAKAAPVTTNLQAQMIPPIRVIRTLPPQKISAGENGKWIFDLGQNIAGWARIRLKAPAGTQLTLKFAEALMPEGAALDHATTGVIHTGFEQTEIYVCKGGGVETWSPRFTYHGFRYVEVAGLPAKPDAEFLKGVLVRSDVPVRGSFECSDETLNRIYRTSLWTIEDNLHSTSEDCPHREKCGWLGDAHAVGETAILNFDMAQFWTKFVDDIGTTLGRGGETYWKTKAAPGIPCNIAVGRRLCQEARPDWAAAYILLPWYLHTYYGDTDVFARHYDHLKRLIEHTATLREDGIVVRGYGDWCPPGGNPKMECPPELTSTAFFYGTLRIMENFARQLGKADDAAGFARLADETEVAFNKKFFDDKTHGYGSQTADAVALRFEMSPAGQRAAVAKSLAGEVVERHGGHAFVGIHGGRPLYTQLSENGYDAAAFGALTKTNWPSYAYTLSQNFTTWPERSDELKPDERIGSRSLNHPMQSGFAAWFHESVGGIRPAAPGFKRIELKPHGYRQIAWAKAEHDSLYGPIKSDWRNADGKFEWNISIPANTTATVHVPAQAADSVTEGGQPAAQSRGVKFLRFENGRAVFEIESGNYVFQSKL
ncbi:MAG: family 78 glycoside hydrolase catalytic domain [Verrucomicrobia bacterium]|nr:family 78 glycoside hydrolase catalytic domain [Verrucomicrobiota bacterium]